jgi:thiol:disulfide interchange protein DsbC
MKAVLLLIAATVLAVARPAAAEDIDLGKALVIGSGTRIVVEFTDPDCPYCRQASRYFEGRTDVKRYVFFNPLSRHPKAKEKAQYVLSQQDRASAYHEVMSGKLDKLQTFSTTPKGIRLQEEQMEVVRKAKVTSTPTFVINGRIITGFEQGQIEQALGPK